MIEITVALPPSMHTITVPIATLSMKPPDDAAADADDAATAPYRGMSDTPTTPDPLDPDAPVDPDADPDD